MLPQHIVDGVAVPKKEGLLFMLPDKFPQVAVKPLVETWKPAESNSAEGPDLVGQDHLAAGDSTEQRTISAAAATKKSDKAWKQQKVFHDITSAKSMCAFSSNQRDQWRALAAFHADTTCSDQVPDLPMTLRAPPAAAETESSWTMQHGSPFSWSGAWDKLAWRYPRPHAPPSSIIATSTEQQADAAAEPAASSVQRVRDDSALINGVTGINAPRAARRRAMD
eukprot:2578222-Pleurochrysis_carterae.AAC.1